MGEEQYFTYVTSHICQTIGESAQSGTPNACIFSPLVAHPVPLFKNFEEEYEKILFARGITWSKSSN